MAKTLFKTFEELKGIAGTIHKMDIATLEGHVFKATEKYIIPAIGREVYTWLLTAYQAGVLNSAQALLLPEVQRPLAFYTLLEAAPAMAIQFGAMGVVEPSADHTASPRQFVMRDAMESYFSSGDLFTDLLLQFLEANKADYSQWAGSSAFTMANKLTIRSTAELEEFVNIEGSRRTFLALRPYLSRADELQLQPVLGQALYDELKAALKAGNLTPEQTKLVEKCRPFVAHVAMVEAVPELTLQVTRDGIKVLSSSDGITQRLQASDNTISALQARHQKSADTYRGYLISFLEKNAADYPLFPASEDASNPVQLQLPDNSDPSAKSFIF